MQSSYPALGKSRLLASPSKQRVLLYFIFFLALGLELSLVAEPGVAQSAAVSITLLPDFPGADAGTTPVAINDQGLIVGWWAHNAAPPQQGFTLSQGSYSSFAPLGAWITQVEGVNNNGDIAGWYLPNGGPRASFVLSGGGFAFYPNFFEILGLNSVGQIVGLSNPCCSGVELTNGSFSTISPPGSGGCQTTPVAINNWGDVVGNYDCNGVVTFFIYRNGVYSVFPNAPNSTVTAPMGINNAGEVVGSATTGGFFWDGANFTTINVLGSSGTVPTGINNRGQIVGYYYDAGHITHGFLASVTRLLDPVPEALNGPNVVSDTTPPNAHGWSGADLLLLFGRKVEGIAADGVSQVTVAIPAGNVGDQFTVTLFNDHSPLGQSNSSDEDGALGKPGDTTFSASQVTVTARATTYNGPTAFAEYRAPVDFARLLGQNTFRTGSCKGTTDTDNNLACRFVSVVIQNLQTNTNYSMTIQIVRPPVMLVHGLWSNPQAWSNFLVTSNGSDDPRFFRRKIDYSGPLTGAGQVTATAPDHGSVQMGRIKGNSVGFEFNAPRVQQQISAFLSEFKSGTNPISVRVAAVQSDIVGHSMGGDLTLGMRLSGAGSQSGSYQRNDNLGQGDVHKLITVDTPYLGSPLATQLLQGYLGTGPSNDCVRGFLDLAGSFSLASVSFASGPTTPGAIYDLQGDGLGSGMSFALEGVTDPILSGPLHIPTAVIAAYMTSANLAPIDTAPVAGIVHKFCGTVAVNPNPIALNLTSAGWPNIFNGANSDAIVPFTSEVNARNGNITAVIPTGSVFQGVHGGGLNLLGFAPPTVLDAGAVPSQVVNLLNTPVTDPATYNIF